MGFRGRRKQLKKKTLISKNQPPTSPKPPLLPLPTMRVPSPSSPPPKEPFLPLPLPTLSPFPFPLPSLFPFGFFFPNTSYLPFPQPPPIPFPLTRVPPSNPTLTHESFPRPLAAFAGVAPACRTANPPRPTTANDSFAFAASSRRHDHLGEGGGEEGEEEREQVNVEEGKRRAKIEEERD